MVVRLKRVRKMSGIAGPINDLCDVSGQARTYETRQMAGKMPAPPKQAVTPGHKKKSGIAGLTNEFL